MHFSFAINLCKVVLDHRDSCKILSHGTGFSDPSAFLPSVSAIHPRIGCLATGQSIIHSLPNGMRNLRCTANANIQHYYRLYVWFEMNLPPQEHTFLFSKTEPAKLTLHSNPLLISKIKSPTQYSWYRYLTSTFAYLNVSWSCPIWTNIV